MDNFHFDITSDRGLEDALKIAFLGAPGKKATHYRVEAASKDDPPARGYGKPKPHGTRLILGWNEALRDGTPIFPAALDADTALPFVLAWLSEQKPAHAAPDHDGDNGRGWRIYNESWGHVADDHYAFIAIEPEWAWYGK